MKKANNIAFLFVFVMALCMSVGLIFVFSEPKEASAVQTTTAVLGIGPNEYYSSIGGSSYSPCSAKLAIHYKNESSSYNGGGYAYVTAGADFGSTNIARVSHSSSGITTLGSAERTVKFNVTGMVSGASLRSITIQYLRDTSLVTSNTWYYSEGTQTASISWSITLGSKTETNTWIAVSIECFYNYILTDTNSTYTQTIHQMTDGKGNAYSANLSKFQKTGYKLSGFYTSSTGGDLIYSVAGSDSVRYTASVFVKPGNLYARYSANQYTVTLNSQGANTAGTTSTTATYDSNMPSITIPTRAGYTFGGYYTGTNGSGTQYYKADGTSARTWNIAENRTLYANWVLKPITLSIDTNGGFYNGANTVIKEMGDTFELGVPTRPGYTFKGWMLEGGDWRLSSLGKASEKLTDGFFATSDNNVKVYNNLPNGTVSFNYISPPIDLNFPHSSRVLEITTAGEASPGLGGFTTNLYSYANAVFYTVIQAKIPVGYTIHAQANGHGSDPQDRWETGSQGTGNWETYIYRWQCGSSGNFSTINFFNIDGPAASASNPVKWQVAYVGTYDATGLGVSGVEGLTSSVTVTFGSENTKVVALWQAVDNNVTIDTDGGTYQGETNFNVQSGTLLQLNVPEKEGYIFNGWTVNGSGSLLEPEHLTTAKTFNGTSDYVNLGRQYMYTDKFLCSMWAYMDNWSEYKDTRLISCTESGGWNIEGSQMIGLGIYDGIKKGYRSIVTSTPWSSLSSGWHNFVATFDGSFAKIFVDGNLLGVSSAFTNAPNGAVGYNSTNSIFIGAEAEVSPTAPVSSYFKGKIANVFIVNDYANAVDEMTSFEQQSYFLSGDSDTTVTANWIETWASSEVELVAQGNDYYISTAEELGAIARMSLFEGQTFANKWIILVDDIDLSGKVWTPISAYNTEFAGHIIGGGHTISGLRTYKDFDDSDTRFAAAGLIGRSNNAEITTLRLANVDIIGGSHVGGFVGHAENTSIERCELASGVVDSRWEGGGIIGYSWDSSVSGCINRANIQSVYPGGIAGGNYASGYVKNSINFGLITGSSRGMCSIGGGIIGVNRNLVYNCINYGDISGEELGDVGGIVGWVQEDSIIQECANYGNIESSGNARRVGVIVGHIVEGISLEMEYCSSVGRLNTKGGYNKDYIFVGGPQRPTSTYANYAWVEINNGGEKEVLKRISEYTGPATFDSRFRYVEGMNNNLPMQISLFSAAAQAPQQTGIYEKYLSDFISY